MSVMDFILPLLSVKSFVLNPNSSSAEAPVLVGEIKLLIAFRKPVPALSASQLCYRKGSLSFTSYAFT